MTLATRDRVDAPLAFALPCNLLDPPRKVVATDAHDLSAMCDLLQKCEENLEASVPQTRRQRHRRNAIDLTDSEELRSIEGLVWRVDHQHQRVQPQVEWTVCITQNTDMPTLLSLAEALKRWGVPACKRPSVPALVPSRRRNAVCDALRDDLAAIKQAMELHKKPKAVLSDISDLPAILALVESCERLMELKEPPDDRRRCRRKAICVTEPADLALHRPKFSDGCVATVVPICCGSKKSRMVLRENLCNIEPTDLPSLMNMVEQCEKLEELSTEEQSPRTTRNRRKALCLGGPSNLAGVLDEIRPVTCDGGSIASDSVVLVNMIEDCERRLEKHQEDRMPVLRKLSTQSNAT
eukprot:TRINITY_DN140_c0_g1_i1.p1 TRINITY_DN140_c0_g1~~TRINITY_DN140_c0_g1_i1.p1  ORF type:complete len:352 (+),score=61.33 TRINITY_DN140_c0_g1_i1:215-1270(+)